MMMMVDVLCLLNRLLLNNKIRKEWEGISVDASYLEHEYGDDGEKYNKFVLTEAG